MYDRWNELMNELPTDNSKIDWYPGCKGCIFVEEDGTGTAYRKSRCIIYDLPYCKPAALSNGSAKCPHFKSKLGESANKFDFELANENYNCYEYNGEKDLIEELEETASYSNRQLLNPMLDNSKATQILSMQLGNNDLPLEVSKEDFSKYVKNNPETPILYRGVDGDLFFDAETLIEDLKYGDVTWLGSSSCLSGVGIYFVGAVGKDIGEIEARKYGQVVCKCCVDLSKVEPIDWKKLENLYGDYAKKHAGTGYFTFMYGDILSTMAMADGYNLIIRNIPGCAFNYYVVLDRSILILESDNTSAEKSESDKMKELFKELLLLKHKYNNELFEDYNEFISAEMRIKELCKILYPPNYWNDIAFCEKMDSIARLAHKELQEELDINLYF